MNIPASIHSRILAAIALFAFALGTAVADGADIPPAPAVKQELIEIMKSVNFVPQLGKDNPICKTFYEDFKQQKNIERIQPIVKADNYDDPALKPYREKCPELDFRLSRWTSGKVDFSHLPKEELEELGTPTYGLGYFQLFKLDINNNPKDGEEIVFYYEGERTLDIVSPEARAYHMIDLANCRIPTAVHFNQAGSAKWTRNGIIRYKGKNAIYEITSSDPRDYYYHTLYMYSEKLRRFVPTCSYHKPR